MRRMCLAKRLFASIVSVWRSQIHLFPIRKLLIADQKISDNCFGPLLDNANNEMDNNNGIRFFYLYLK